MSGDKKESESDKKSFSGIPEAVFVVIIPVFLFTLTFPLLWQKKRTNNRTLIYFLL